MAGIETETLIYCAEVSLPSALAVELVVSFATVPTTPLGVNSLLEQSATTWPAERL